jgi:hypothetical protein
MKPNRKYSARERLIAFRNAANAIGGEAGAEMAALADALDGQADFVILKEIAYSLADLSIRGLLRPEHRAVLDRYFG